AGAVLGPLTEELADARGHWRSPHGCKAANRRVVRVVNSSPGARWGRTGERGLLTRCAALDWNGELPFRTAGNDEQASSVATPAVEAGRDQGSPVRRCFKPRPPLSAGCAGFASGCRSSGFRSSGDHRLNAAILLRA